MAENWMIRVYNDGTLAVLRECAAPVELGRQDQRIGETLYQVTPSSSRGVRLAIAPTDDLKVSRRHARLEGAGPNRAIVRNTSDTSSITFDDGFTLRPGQAHETELPIVLRFGIRVVRVEKPTSSGEHLIEPLGNIRCLDEPVAAFGDDSGWAEAGTSTIALASSGPLDARKVFDWLRTMIKVLQSAASDSDFFHKTARAVVEVACLDVGRVLSRDGGDWKTVAFYPDHEADYEQNNPPSRMILNRVLAEKKVAWLDPHEDMRDCTSLSGVSSVVVAPVQSRSGEVIAVLYGERRIKSMLSSAGRPVSKLDAMLMEVLAVGLSTGLARVEQERAALAMLAQFEQFFTPELTRVLAAQPKLLEGRDQEISVLFGDIRGFSRITRHQPPAFTVEWTQDVLSTLSECVLDHQGVLVDYIGDEIMAMWGAPEAQPDHAELACRAAIDMIDSINALNARWQDRLGEPMGIGIGINSGIARVGNTGSRRKFKYGPLGDTVNVASRVQGASKYFKSSLLITKATRDRLGPGFPLRRLGGVRMVNISDPIELFELGDPEKSDQGEINAIYEEALCAYEAGEFRKATGILGRLVSTHGDDGPTFALLARTISHYVEPPEKFDPAFRLPGK